MLYTNYNQALQILSVYKSKEQCVLLYNTLTKGKRRCPIIAQYLGFACDLITVQNFLNWFKLVYRNIKQS